MKWTVGKKIGAGFALAVAIMAIIGINSYFALNRLVDAASWKDHTYQVMNNLNTLLSDLKDAETGQRGYIITGEGLYLEPYNTAIGKIEPDIEILRKQTADNQIQQERIVTLKAKTVEKLSELAETVNLRKLKGLGPATELVLTDKGKKTMDEIQKVVAEMKTEEEALMVQRSSKVDAYTSNAKILIVGGIILAVALIALTGLIIVRSTATSITSIIEGIATLGSSASEILASTTQVASGTAETATAISETSATVEEVRQAARLSSDKAQSVSDSAQRVAEVSRSGLKAVEETATGMLRIRGQMESIAQSIVRLSEQSQSIGGIIASVTDLADQSNLLAVNAAIEAVGAGEQGKRFAVVAQEIRSLAEQSKQATAQVRDILSDIQKATSAAVMATEQGAKAVDAGVRQSEQTGEAIRLLAESSAEAAQASTQIVASSHQQVIGMDQIGTAMENINQAGAQTAASMSQAETAARDLNELGMKLKQLVEQYKN